MNLYIRGSSPVSGNADRATDQHPMASLRVVGLATTSAITELVTSTGVVKAGDWADLTATDSAVAAANVTSLTGSSSGAVSSLNKDAGASGSVEGVKSKILRSAENSDTEVGARIAGRIGIDYSGISSSGSTPGANVQVGMSFQSDMTHVLA